MSTVAQQVLDLYASIGRDPATVPQSDLNYWLAQGITGVQLQRAFLTAAASYINDPTFHQYGTNAAALLKTLPAITTVHPAGVVTSLQTNQTVQSAATSLGVSTNTLLIGAAVLAFLMLR